MVTSITHGCPTCQSTHIVKNGYTTYGQQRCLCHGCGKTRVLVPSAASQELLGFHRTLRSRATSESGGRSAGSEAENAPRSPPTGREAIQRLFPRMSCEAALSAITEILMGVLHT